MNPFTITRSSRLSDSVVQIRIVEDALVSGDQEAVWQSVRRIIHSSGMLGRTDSDRSQSSFRSDQELILTFLDDSDRRVNARFGKCCPSEIKGSRDFDRSDTNRSCHAAEEHFFLCVQTSLERGGMPHHQPNYYTRARSWVKTSLSHSPFGMIRRRPSSRLQINFELLLFCSCSGTSNIFNRMLCLSVSSSVHRGWLTDFRNRSFHKCFEHFGWQLWCGFQVCFTNSIKQQTPAHKQNSAAFETFDPQRE